MTSPRPLPNLWTELRYEFATEYQRIRSSSRAYAAILGTIAVVFTIFAFFKLGQDFSRLPMFLFAGVVHALQYIGLYALVCAFVAAKIVYVTTHERLEASWTEKEARRKPGQTFAVAYWRFILVAAPAAVGTFAVLVLCIATIFFWLPLHLDPLAQVLQAMAPND